MRQFWTGVIAALLLSGSGIWIWQLVANDKQALPEGAPPPVPGEAPLRGEPIVLPVASATAPKSGPALPQTAIYQPSREEKRFNRYDRDRDDIITRVEMLSTRTNAFRKLDKDGNNLLTFEEWAVATSDRFTQADANRDKLLTRAEFATTRRKTTPKPKCKC